MTRRILALALTLAFVALPAASAHAGEDAEEAKLRLLESMGRRAHQEERYADAIDAFEAAYLMRQDPRYLYNIGRSHEHNGDLGQAVDYLQRYLQQVTDPKDRADAEAVLAVMRVKLDRQASGGGEPLPDAYPEPPEENLPPEEAGTWPNWAALSTLAAGAGLLAGGAVFGVLAGRAEDRRDGLKGAEPVPASRFIQEDDAARRDALVANVLLGTGAAAVVTGAVLLLLDLPGDGAQPALALVPLPGGLGVSVGVTR